MHNSTTHANSSLPIVCYELSNLT